MASGQADLCRCAISSELAKLRKIRLDSAFILVLEAWLQDIYSLLRPHPCDYEKRAALVKAFNALAKDSFGANGGFPVVEAFGSFIMDLFTSESDLDLSINFSSDDSIEVPRHQKISALKKFVRFLYKVQRKGHISEISPVFHAKVPVVKVVDSGTGIECDVSAENKDGISRSLILSVISSIDERFQILSYLMKAWAKAHDINSSKDRTMNSLSIISLVAFHLQTREPPVLPHFSVLFKDGTDIASIQNVAFGFKGFGRRNKESISELFITLLVKLSSVETLWSQGLCVSTFGGTWIEKKWRTGTGNMSIEDFLDRSQNFARAVGEEEMKKIYSSIKHSLEKLSRAMDGEFEEKNLKECLFGSVPLRTSHEGLKRTVPFEEPDLTNPIIAKRPRYAGPNNFRPDIPLHLEAYGPWYPPPPVAALHPHPGFNPHFLIQPTILPHLGFRPEFQGKSPFIPEHHLWLGNTRDLGHQQNPFVPRQPFYFVPNYQ